MSSRLPGARRWAYEKQPSIGPSYPLSAATLQQPSPPLPMRARLVSPFIGQDRGTFRFQFCFGRRCLLPEDRGDKVATGRCRTGCRATDRR
jgi:hypothetical protein